MILWFFLTLLCCATAIGISMPLLRRLDTTQPPNNDAVIYEDQLKEIERDLQTGAINAPESEAAKLEITRRIAIANKHVAEVRPISNAARNAALVASAGLVILGSVGLYSMMGSPNLPSAILQVGVNAQSAQVDALLAKLTTHLAKNPGDAEGWRMLGWSQFNLQNYAQSAESYARAASLQPTNMDYKSAQAEALVQMAEGVVTPKAQGLIAEVLAKQPKDSRARFYNAMAHEQSGDQSGALDLWLALLADTPLGAGWRGEVKVHIADLAKATGRDVAQTIQALPESDQNAMIKNMVEGLAKKLADNPKDLEGWLRLMRSYQVLGEPVKAKEALAKALSTFATDADSTAKIKAAANELGLD